MSLAAGGEGLSIGDSITLFADSLFGFLHGNASSTTDEESLLIRPLEARQTMGTEIFQIQVRHEYHAQERLQEFLQQHQLEDPVCGNRTLFVFPIPFSLLFKFMSAWPFSLLPFPFCPSPALPLPIPHPTSFNLALLRPTQPPTSSHLTLGWMPPSPADMQAHAERVLQTAELEELAELQSLAESEMTSNSEDQRFQVVAHPRPTFHQSRTAKAINDGMMTFSYIYDGMMTFSYIHTYIHI